jgi:hypothetical protein
VNYSGSGGSSGRRGFRYRSLPIWLQWVIPFAVAAILVLALVLFVNHETNSVPQIATVTPSAAKEENREDTILVRQQQAPHTAKLSAGASAVNTLRGSITSWMAHQISLGNMNGPIKRLSCRTTAASTSARLVYSCDLTASAALTYPFDGVVQRSTGTITWCQRVAPPVPSMNVPVSKRCT